MKGMKQILSEKIISTYHWHFSVPIQTLTLDFSLKTVIAGIQGYTNFITILSVL